MRESTEEQGKGFSPDAQREAIRRFAEENELELVDDYCDFHSGWKQADGRPEFQACGGFSRFERDGAAAVTSEAREAAEGGLTAAARLVAWSGSSRRTTALDVESR